jgi:citrate synthase
LTRRIVKIDYAINMKNKIELEMVSSDLYVGADEAARWLGVGRATLYAYVSRGLIRSEPVAGSKARRYFRADLETLARRGRGAGPRASASALRFGEPLLESTLTLIDEGRLFYRGHDAVELAQSHSFEAVANLLWFGELRVDGWPASEDLERLAPLVEQLARLNRNGLPLERAMAGLMAVAIHDEGRFAVMREQVARSAGTLVRTVVALLAPEKRVRPCLAAATVAEAFWYAASDRAGAPSREEVSAINAALVLCADHELNASTFAARITASTGASLPAIVTAALAALSGPRHGGVSDRIEALFREIEREAKGTGDVGAAFAARLARGEAVSGFGHPLYPRGDPRYGALRQLCGTARTTVARRATLARLDAAIATGRRLGYGQPTLDFGLVALRVALGFPAGAAAAIFASGRAAGWIAHALEQSGSTQLLRPRARYVGPPPQ